MEKPEDVPQAIWDRALCHMEAADWPTWLSGAERRSAATSIAKAILSAVEEEAQKIEAMADALYEKADAEGIAGRDSAFAAWVTQNIASTIRNRKGA